MKKGTAIEINGSNEIMTLYYDNDRNFASRKKKVVREECNYTTEKKEK